MDAINTTKLARALWALMLCYWFYGARNVKAVASPERSLSRAAHLTTIVSAFVLLLYGDWLPAPFRYPIFPTWRWQAWFGLGVTALGVAFAIWARATLGANWSGAVTLKKDHKIIQAGPYRWVRHPIYTGIIFGAVGTALVTGEVRGWIAVALIKGAYLVKIQKEERLLREHFPDEYPAYASRTKKLVPGIY